ncbi:hypothetical protein ABZV60_19410 [Streptomyces sp. NPDC004787]|uniref:hypothetical protein n=1 Tax=Streptomyces sp. NPDC004787 TaxID=3154291 RepID=UPI0033ADEF9C
MGARPDGCLSLHTLGGDEIGDIGSDLLFCSDEIGDEIESGGDEIGEIGPLNLVTNPVNLVTGPIL